MKGSVHKIQIAIKDIQKRTLFCLDCYLPGVVPYTNISDEHLYRTQDYTMQQQSR
jgi:hypothetical protein